MSEKYWFIFNGDHHLGPFSFEQMLEKVNNDEMQSSQLVWQEGDPEWLPFIEHPNVQTFLANLEAEDAARQQEELERLERERIRKEREIELQKKFQKLREKEIQQKKVVEEEVVPPPLPPLPPIEEGEEIIEEEVDEVPPPLPPLPVVEENVEEVVEDVAEEEPEIEEVIEEVEPEVYDDSEFFEDEEEVSSFELKGSRFYLSLGLVAIGVGLLLYFTNASFQETRVPVQVSKSTREALLRVADRDFNGKVIHRLRTTKDYTRLWLGTNFPYEGVVYLKLRSIKGKTLSREENTKARLFIPEVVEVQSQAPLKGKMAYFHELEILAGDSLLPGVYEYEISGKRVGMMATMSSFLRDKPFFNELSFTQDRNQNFKLKGTILLSPLSEEDFNKRLEAEKKSLEKNLIRPLTEFKERYAAFIGLLDRTEDLYQEIMRRITKGSSISMFESRYNKEVGPMLTDLIGDCYRRHLSLLNTQPEQSKGYEDLNNYGKDIGLIASEMVTKTREVSRLKRQNTQEHVDYFKKKVSELREKGREEIRLIEERLKGLQ